MAEIKVDRELGNGYGESLSVYPQDVYELDEKVRCSLLAQRGCTEGCSCVEAAHRAQYEWMFVSMRNETV